MADSSLDPDVPSEHDKEYIGHSCVDTRSFNELRPESSRSLQTEAVVLACVQTNDN